jgi:hypothetical protein
LLSANLHYKGYENKALVAMYLAAQTQCADTTVDATYLGELGKLQRLDLAFINGYPTSTELDDGDQTPGRYCFNLRATPQFIQLKIEWFEKTLNNIEFAFPKTMAQIRRLENDLEQWTADDWTNNILNALLVGRMEFRHWFVTKFLSTDWCFALLACPATAKEAARAFLRAIDGVAYPYENKDLKIKNWGSLAKLNFAELKVRATELGLISPEAKRELVTIAGGSMTETYQQDPTHNYWTIHKYFKQAYPSINAIMIVHIDGTPNSNAIIEQYFSISGTVMHKNGSNTTNSIRMFLSTYLKDIERSVLANLKITKNEATSKRATEFHEAYNAELHRLGGELQSAADRLRSTGRLASRRELVMKNLTEMDKMWSASAVTAEVKETSRPKYGMQQLQEATQKIQHFRKEHAPVRKVIWPTPSLKSLKAYVKGTVNETKTFPVITVTRDSETETFRYTTVSFITVTRPTFTPILHKLFRIAVLLPNAKPLELLYDNATKDLRMELLTKTGKFSTKLAFEYLEKALMIPYHRVCSRIIEFLGPRSTSRIHSVLKIITARYISELCDRPEDRKVAMATCYPGYQVGNTGVIQSDKATSKEAAKEATGKPKINMR